MWKWACCSIFCLDVIVAFVSCCNGCRILECVCRSGCNVRSCFWFHWHELLGVCLHELMHMYCSAWNGVQRLAVCVIWYWLHDYVACIWLVWLLLCYCMVRSSYILGLHCYLGSVWSLGLHCNGWRIGWLCMTLNCLIWVKLHCNGYASMVMIRGFVARLMLNMFGYALVLNMWMVGFVGWCKHGVVHFSLLYIPLHSGEMS